MSLTAQVLADPVNDLAENVVALEQSADAVWHIDRHVIDVDESAPVIEACLAAVALARHWMTQASRLRSSTRFISKPYAILDPSWLSGEPDAPPPHVYICLAREQAAFAPAYHQELVERPSTGIAQLDEGLAGEGRLFWVDGWHEEPGCWIFEPNER